MRHIRAYSTALSLMAYLTICFYTIPYAKMAAIEDSPPIVAAKKFDKKEMVCLAKNIFFEARGTDEAEMIRVINVTTNRVKLSGDSYCGVVYRPGQFSWTFDLIKNNIGNFINHTLEAKAWDKAKELATYQLAYGFKDTTDGSLFYHAYYVNPHWPYQETVASNYHIYYRP